MSKIIPHVDPQSTYSGHVPAELLGGPHCGLPLMVDAACSAITAVCPATGEKVVYIPSELRSRTGCRLFVKQQEIPF